ncbi:MAG: hypothetical protein N2491_10945 [Negativicutes bacterium]|nr:hypothetical protein [Negativicutes bacterium]
MSIAMSRIPVKAVYLDSRLTDENGTYEFTVDCGSVYFGAVYDQEGELMFVDQYFYSDTFSPDKLTEAISHAELLNVEMRDYPVKAYLLAKNINGNEWVRFHAVVSQNIDPDYFHQKYIGE